VLGFNVPSYTALSQLTALRLNYKPKWFYSNVGSDVTLVGSLLNRFSEGAVADGGLLNGIYTTKYLPTVEEPDNPWTQLFTEVWEAHGDGKPMSNFRLYGMAQAYTYVSALQAAGEDLTRDGIVEALEEQGSEFEGPWLAPLDYSADSHRGISGLSVNQIEATSSRSSSRWRPPTAGRARSSRSRTSRSSPPRTACRPSSSPCHVPSAATGPCWGRSRRPLWGRMRSDLHHLNLHRAGPDHSAQRKAPMSLTIASILAESAARHPDRTAVVLGDLRLTYAQLWGHALQYAAVLREKGVGPGDKVAMLLPEHPALPADLLRDAAPRRGGRCRCTRCSRPRRSSTSSRTPAPRRWSAPRRCSARAPRAPSWPASRCSPSWTAVTRRSSASTPRRCRRRRSRRWWRASPRTPR
jgi:hypothetical protein